MICPGIGTIIGGMAGGIIFGAPVPYFTEKGLKNIYGKAASINDVAGITHRATFINCLDVLECNENESFEEISRNYKYKTLLYHPDKVKDESSKEINMKKFNAVL
jgi:DnaJ-class molecular chaperone